MKRALRRHHKNRMRKRSIKIYSKYYHPPERSKYWADNITVCSCYMCGNPRKWFKERTLQERKHGW